MTSETQGSTTVLDHCLFQAGQERDRKAFRQWCQYYTPRLNGWLLQRPIANPQSVLAVILVRAWQQASHFNPKHDHSSAWLWRQVRAVLYQHDNASIDIHADDLWPKKSEGHP